MKNLKLHEIISLSEEGKSSMLIELIAPYKNSLLTYYRNYHNCEPVLMVTNVFNSCSYGLIVPDNELHEAICTYLDNYNCSDQDNEDYSTYETICFNSIALEKL